MPEAMYFTDRPEMRDALDFVDFRPALSEVLLLGETPLTVGIFGPWGSGKTSLLHMLQQDVQYWGVRLRPQVLVRTVWFTAWKYERREALWRALLLRVLDALYPRVETEPSLPWHQRPRKPDSALSPKERKLVTMLERLEQSLYREVTWEEVGQWTVHWWELMKAGGRVAADLALLFLPLPEGVRKLLQAWEGEALPENLEKLVRAVRREMRTYRMERLASIEQFEAAFQQALHLAWEAQNTERGRLILFIDDLDRCLPEKALEILEAIKLFLEVEGTAFVLALDREVIRRGVEAYYAHYAHTSEPPINGDAYLQKFVQIPFTLPPLAVHQVERMLRLLAESAPPETAPLEGFTLPVAPEERPLTPDLYRIFATGLRPNPRQVKRAVNTFRLLQAVALVREQRGSLPPRTAWPLLAKIVVMQLEFPEVYEAWLRVGYETLLPALEMRLYLAAKETAASFPEFLQKRMAQFRAGEIPEHVQKEARRLIEALQQEPNRFLRFTAFFLYEGQGRGLRDRYRFLDLTPAELSAYQRLVAPLQMMPSQETMYGDVVEALQQGDPQALWQRLLTYRSGSQEQRSHLARWLPFLLKQRDMPAWVLEGARAILQQTDADLARTMLYLAAREPQARGAAFQVLRLQQLVHHVLPMLKTPELDPNIQQMLIELLKESALSSAQRRSLLADPRAAQTLFDMIPQLGDAALVWIQEALHMPDPSLRLRALEALETLQARAHVALVREALKDPVPEVRARAARLLGLWQDTQALDSLVTLLRDRDLQVQQAALQALQQYGPAVLPYLEPYMETPIPSFRERLMEVIAALDRDETRHELRRWLQSHSPRKREAAAWLLGRLGRAEDLLHLARSLNDPDPGVQQSARETLSALYTRLGSEALETFLAHLLGLHAEARLPYLQALYLLKPHLREGDRQLVRRALERILDSTSSLASQERIRRLLREMT